MVNEDREKGQVQVTKENIEIQILIKIILK